MKSYLEICAGLALIIGPIWAVAYGIHALPPWTIIPIMVTAIIISLIGAVVVGEGAAKIPPKK